MPESGKEHRVIFLALERNGSTSARAPHIVREIQEDSSSASRYPASADLSAQLPLPALERRGVSPFTSKKRPR